MEARKSSEAGPQICVIHVGPASPDQATWASQGLLWDNGAQVTSGSQSTPRAFVCQSLEFSPLFSVFLPH